MSDSTVPQELTSQAPAPPTGGTLRNWLFEDQRKRWTTGERPSVASYLERHAALRADPALAADLVYNEYLLRREVGQSPDFNEYLAAYPQYADDLRMLHEVNGGMEKHGLLTGIQQAAGEEFGDYCLLEEIGRGGMGIVYRARQKSLKRIVALKMLRAGEWSDDGEKDRFRREAEAAAALQHPNIVAVHEVGEETGRLYFSMDYVEGQSLAQMVQENPLPPRDAARYVEAIARAVHCAHQRGVIHRDLKPSNVLVDKASGQPRVTDFGLAKRTETDARLTGSGQVLGTPSYMPPEQASGKQKAVGPAADVYSLGATLYELLTGRPPFRAETVFETIRQVLEAEPAAPRVVNPGVPRDLDTICLKCLRKDPAGRYTSAKELAEDLRRYLDGRPIKARPVPQWERAGKWCRRRPAAATLTAVLMIGIPCGAVAVWRYEKTIGRLATAKAVQEEHLRSEVALQETKAEAAREIATLTDYAANAKVGWTYHVLESIDKINHLAVAGVDRPALQTVAARALASVDLRARDEFARGMNPYCLAFSPDGNRLAVGQFKGVPLCSVELIDLESRRAKKLSWPTLRRQNQTGVRALTFSPDGRWLVAGMRGGEVYRWDTAEPAPRPMTWNAHTNEVSGLAFRPDGKLLVSCSPDGTLGRWEVEGWQKLPPVPLGAKLTRLAFSPGDGKWLACGSWEGLRFYDADALLAPAPALKPLWQFAGHHGPFCFSPDGRRVAVVENGRLRLYETHPHEVVQDRRDRFLSAEEAHEGGVTHLHFHPDSSLLVSGGHDQKLKVWEVASGRQLASIFLGGQGNIYPAFHPDGRSLAVTADEVTLDFELAGLREQTLLAHHDYLVRAFAFAPDGTGLACTAANDPRMIDNYLGEVTLWKKDGTFREAKGFAARNGDAGRSAFCLALHPTGGSLAYTDAAGRGFYLWDVGRKVVTGPVEAPAVASLSFTPDGAALWAACDPAMVASWRWPGLEPGTDWKNSGAVQVQSRIGMKCVAAGRDWLLAGSADSTTKLFRLREGGKPVKEKEWLSPQTLRPADQGAGLGALEALLNPSKGSNGVLCVALNRDETLAASGTESGAVQVVSVPGGEALGSTLRGHQDNVQSVAFSPDGEYLATGSRDRTVRLWQRGDAGFREVIVLPAPGPVARVEFSPDGTQLGMLVQKEHAVRVWHLDRLRGSLHKLGIDW